MYTDGSGIGGNVNAATYTLNSGESRGKYMGSEKTHTVYNAELEAIYMAICSIRSHPHDRNIIFSDSQAAIKAIAKPKR